MVNIKKIEEVKQLLLPLAKEMCVKAIWISNYNEQSAMLSTNILIDDTLSYGQPLRDLRNQIFTINSRAANLGVRFMPIRKLSKFLDLLKHGDQTSISTLSNVILIYDPPGYIRMLNSIMHKGKIYGTEERALKLFEKAKEKYLKANHIISNEIMSQAYLAMVESAQAALLFAGKHPGQIETLPQDLRKCFGALLDENVVNSFSESHNAMESLKKDGKPFDSNNVEKLLASSKKFARHMQDTAARFESGSEERIVEDTFRHSIKKCSELLSVPLTSESGIMESFRKKLLEQGLASQHNLQTLAQMYEYSKASNKEKKILIKSKFLDRSHLHSLKTALDELCN